MGFFSSLFSSDKDSGAKLIEVARNEKVYKFSGLGLSSGVLGRCELWPSDRLLGRT